MNHDDERDYAEEAENARIDRDEVETDFEDMEDLRDEADQRAFEAKYTVPAETDIFDCSDFADNSGHDTLIGLDLSKLVKGAIFDTPFETGCKVTNPPGFDPFAPSGFEALDSDGVECLFTVEMVCNIY